MEGGGSLYFSSESLRLDNQAAAALSADLAPGDYICISISDTGTGMSDETISHIFEPFFTTKEVGKGTGLGLPAVYGTLKNHHGYLHVTSELGRGSTFSCYFPASDQQGNQDEEEALQIQSSKTLNVLLIEDEAIVSEMAIMLLESLGHHVTVCEDGVAATDYYPDHAEDIDIIILDIIMPRMGGHDTYIELQKINPKLKVLLSSGYSLNRDVQDILDMGANGFIQKPFQVDDLINSLEELIGDGGESKNS